MSEKKDRDAAKSGRSRVLSAVLSLVVPGLGQVVRGRIFAGLLFFLNAILYFVPLFIAHNVDYDIQTPSLLIALGIWICSALDAFLYKSSFLVLALLVSFFCFGTGFFGALLVLPKLDI